MISHIIQSIATFLFPLQCSNCGTKGSALCVSCLSKIEPTPYSTHHIHSFYSYKNSLVRKIIRELKYKRNTTALLPLVEKSYPIAEKIIKMYPQAEKVFVPIPKHRSKERIQGYNQSALIAAALSSFFSIPTQTILKKTKPTIPQVKTKSRSERLQNNRHSMEATSTLSKTVLYIIVDDVYTTGATIAEAKRALKENGANFVCAVTLAH